MKHSLMLAACFLLAANELNAQMLVGPKSSDTLLLLTSNVNRIRITPTHPSVAAFSGQVLVNEALTQYGFYNYKPKMAIEKGASDLGLHITDNSAMWVEKGLESICNTYASYGLYVNNAASTTTWTGADHAGIYSAGANLGYYRVNQTLGNNSLMVGNYCVNDAATNPSHTGLSYISFASGGISGAHTVNSVIDFQAAAWYDESSTEGTRYGLKLEFAKASGMTAAWGVYQSSNTVLNHFNGNSLFGSTTDNTYDKVQSTGGTKTDGFAAGIRTVTTDPTIVNTDYTILCNGQADITFPTSGIATGKIFVIKKIDGSPTTVTFSTNIDGAAYPALTTQYEGVMVQYNGSGYYLIGKF